MYVSQKTLEKPRTKVKTKAQRPPLWKVILLNDDYTPREFVVLVLKAVFRMNESHAYKVMMTAHQKGACVIAVYTRDVADTKANHPTIRVKQAQLFFFDHGPLSVARRAGAHWLLVDRARAGPASFRLPRAYSGSRYVLYRIP